MVRISGFFCSHGHWSINTIAAMIEETRATFSQKGNNVYFLELFTEGAPIEYVEKVVKYQQLSQEMFIRSATEKNLLKLFTEVGLGNVKLAQKIATMSEGQVREYASKNLIRSTLFELSKLRKTIDFQLLFESGTTPEKDALIKQRHGAILKAKSSWGVNFNAYINASAEEMRYMSKISLIRESLARQKIDGLMAQYQNQKLNIQVLFGSAHKNMLEQYRECKDISLREIVLDEPGIPFMIDLYDSIMAGKVVTTEEKLAFCLWGYLQKFSKQIFDFSGIILHPGDYFDIMRQSLSASQLESVFFCRDQMSRIARLIKETGALDVLENKNPTAGNFVSILADRPIGSTDSKKAPPQNPGRNTPCPCGSGKKYKKCCGK